MRLMSTLCPLVAAQEIKKGFGEDAYIAGSAGDTAYQGVFDGCGGLGGRHYELLDEHTGAWAASRVMAYASQTYFCENTDVTSGLAQGLHARMTEVLESVKRTCVREGEVQIGGDLKKNFPTTVSAAVIREENGALSADYLWAGDSRGYFLDTDGLCQVTYDDIDANGDDAFLNLREDGRLTNVANADSPFEIHQRHLEIEAPAMVINATDGCFAYFKTPMEFELVLVETLVKADSPEGWINGLKRVIGSVAGDDFTMTISIFGYESFEALKNSFGARLEYLSKYFRDREGFTPQILEKLWNAYRSNYYRRGLL